MLIELQENRKYILVAYIISFFTILPQLIATIASNGSLNHIILLIIVFIIVSLTSKFSRVLFTIFIIYLNITNIFIWHIFLHWGYLYTNSVIRMDIALISPKSEIIEYLLTYIDYRDILFIIYTIFILISLYKFIIYFKHSFNKIKYVSLIISILIVSFLIYSHKNILKKSEPLCFVYKFMEALNASKICNTRRDIIKNIKLSSQKINSVYNKIIIIQGESANKHHMAIYGYDRNTTPFFSKLKNKDNFYIFNAISPANQTRYSIPILYTKATVQNFIQLFLHSKSILGYYGSYGYDTYWISNQTIAGKYNNNVVSVGREAYKYYFINRYLHNDKSKPDYVLISYLYKNHIKKVKKGNQLYVFHLMGSHFMYKYRYTKKHTLFKYPKNIVDKYDNTIFYTDYIIKNIFNYFLDKFPKDKILFIYISDHGEVVNNNLFGHGFLPPYKDEYEIPFIIYSTIKNSRIDKLLIANKKHYLNLENFNYIIDYISGVSNDLNISYSNKIFAVSPSNLFNYDKLQFYKNNK